MDGGFHTLVQFLKRHCFMCNGLITGLVGCALQRIVFHILHFPQAVKRTVTDGNKQVRGERSFDCNDLPVLPKIEENVVNNFFRNFSSKF
jgi:hypothetical protein